MARRGRNRKEGPRTASGALKRTPDRIKPTPEMMRHKRSCGGAEVGDPLAFVPLTDAEREAIGRYCQARRAAGWGVRSVTAAYDDTPKGNGLPEEVQTKRDRDAEDNYEKADAALMSAGPAAHRAIANYFSFRCVMGAARDFKQGAAALADFFRIYIEPEDDDGTTSSGND